MPQFFDKFSDHIQQHFICSICSQKWGWKQFQIKEIFDLCQDLKLKKLNRNKKLEHY